MSDLLILGAGGHAMVVAETALSSGVASRIVFLDDSCTNPDDSLKVLGWPVVGPLPLSLELATRSRFQSVAVAIGDASIRLRWIEKLKDAGYKLPVLVHPSAWVSPSATIGDGSVVFAQAVIQPQASTGMGVILNTSSSIDHGVCLADAVHICPGARLAADVQVGRKSWIGIGASVLQQVSIGSDVTVGAGAVVIRDLPDSVTAAGVPARILFPRK